MFEAIDQYSFYDKQCAPKESFISFAKRGKCYDKLKKF
jgi:hypothetical protein